MKHYKKKVNDRGHYFSGKVVKSFKRDGFYVRIYEPDVVEFVPSDYYELEDVGDYLFRAYETTIDDFEIVPGWWDDPNPEV